MIHGTFLEAPRDAHVARRAALLEHSALPPSQLPSIVAPAATFLSDGRGLTKAALDSHGLAVIQLDEPLSTTQFIAFGNALGTPIPERAPEIQQYVDDGVVLNLHTRFGPTRDVARQPFASNFLTLHSESSGRRVSEQPRYIVLMCVDPGESVRAPQTVVVPMRGVVERLLPAAVSLLSQTRYAGRPGPPILRQEGGRWIVCFRDFQSHSLDWEHTGPGGGAAVNDAIRQLLASMYAPQGALSVVWKRGLVVVIDNQFHVHGRSAGAFHPDGRQRHLIRLRIGAAAATTWDSPDAAQDAPQLFSRPLSIRLSPDHPGAAETAALSRTPHPTSPPLIDARTCEVFARAADPTDAMELHDLWLGRVEAELGPIGLRSELAELWRTSKVRRSVSAEEVLSSRATVQFVKEIFNTYFRDDLYGSLRSDDNLILSSGSVDEEAFSLPSALKETVRYALSRDWYGYSDPRGRESARVAVAGYESARMHSGVYNADNVALTLGATHAIASLASFVLVGCRSRAPALCGIPNYPPLVEAVARQHAVQLVPMPSEDGRTSLSTLQAALTPQTPMVLIQTAANPSGAITPEPELERFIDAASPSTIIVLDECHEWLGSPRQFSRLRARPNVVRVSSLSKAWSTPGLKIGWFVADEAFVLDYYEYASSHYGGPPSLYYTLVEFLANFERWKLQGLPTVGIAEVRSFEASYGLTVRGLQAAYRSYREERRSRDRALRTLRDASVAGLQQAGAEVLRPRFSINISAAMPGASDSYALFRTVLHDTGVSLYPGLLCFQMAGGCFRISSSQRWELLSEAFERLRRE